MVHLGNVAGVDPFDRALGRGSRRHRRAAAHTGSPVAAVRRWGSKPVTLCIDDQRLKLFGVLRRYDIVFSAPRGHTTTFMIGSGHTDWESSGET